MFIIIRNMPLVHYDPRTHQSKLFLEGGVGASRRRGVEERRRLRTDSPISARSSTHAPHTPPHPLLRAGQGQLGAEGYIMGSQYMLLGLIVAAGTHLLPRLRDEHKRRTWGYILLVAGFLTFRSIMGTFIWKTHMKTEWY